MARNRVKVRRRPGRIPFPRFLHGWVLPAAVALLASLLPACRQSRGQVDQTARRLNNQGVVYMDQHNYTRAREEFAAALALDPRYALAHANLGIAYYSLGKYDSAGVSLRQALSLDSHLLQAHYTLGLIASAQGREYEQALRSLETVHAAAPADPQVLYYLGQAQSKLGQTDAAIASLQEAVRLDPFNVSAYYALAGQYRQQGRETEWRNTLQEFSRLNQAGHRGVSSGYQGQGRYAEAVIDAEGIEPTGQGPDRAIRLSAAEETDGTSGLRDALPVDDDRDGDDDLLLLTDRVLLRPQENGVLAAPRDLGLRLPLTEGPVRACAVDLDNDGDTDLALNGNPVRIYRRQGPATWDEGLPLPLSATAAFAGDADHDGDLDLLLATVTGTSLWTNDGRAVFTDRTSAAGLDPALAAHKAIFSDLDNDRDLDLVLLGDAGLQVWANDRDGTFSEAAADLGLTGTAGARDLCVEDFDQNAQMDLAVLSADGAVQLWRGQAGQRFTEVAVVPTGLEEAWGLAAADLDADGDLDLIVYGRGGLRVLQSRDAGLEPVLSEPPGTGDLSLVHLADYDGDGLPDLWADGALRRNESHPGHWLRVQTQGLGSNRDGLGTKVEVKTATRLQKLEVRRRGPLTFGLADADTVEFVRLLWPGGVRQTELATPVDRTLTISELDRKGTSCPVVYVWDGTRFRFVSDVNGGAIIGYLLAPGRYAATDTDEYLPLGPVAPRDGRYVVQLGNHLEEVIYVDALQLVAVDHPPSVTVYPNERLLSAPPFPPFSLYPLTDLRPPVGAVDHRGRDVLARLTAVDDQWYDGFELTDVHGYARDWSLTLDLGDLRQVDHPVLVAHGWVDYAHSTSNWAAAQRGWTLYPPRVEVPDGRGGWVQVSADLGTPAGLPKAMVFDLKGLFPARDFRLRLTTNTAVYWDAFAVGAKSEAPLRVQRLEPLAGDLHWRGYPEHTALHGTFAFRYDYDRLSREAPWGTHGGGFTRYGAVRDLIDRVDDRFAVMLHGDELTAEFDTLAPPAPGMARSFLLYSDGFGKDMDLHSARSLTVEPLPFHGMSTYPYPAGEGYPADSAHAEYVQSYNTRRLEGYYR